LLLMSNQAIGIFDSGIGGTSIWKEVHKLLPNENTIYIADSLNAPYGQKTKEQIIHLCEKNTEFLLNKNCKLIIVACNTATTNAINHLRSTYNIPFIGIEPAIKPAALKTKTNVIGILATKGTLNSSLFEKTSSLINSNIKIIEQIGEGLVELIEKGAINSKQMDITLKKYLQPMLDQNIDCLVLGCTHYPYLTSKIKGIVGNSVNIIDSGEAVAIQTQKMLTLYDMSNFSTLKSKNIFYSSGDKKILQQILNKEVLKIKS